MHTAIGARRRGWIIRCGYCVTATKGSKGRHASFAENTAYETYSLSFLAVRTSGSLPRRPTRMSLHTSDERDAVVDSARRLIGIDTRLMLRESKENMTVRGIVTGSARGFIYSRGCASPQPHARTDECSIPLITILKTLVKRCILIMSRHRFVRNLDLDGNYFPYCVRCMPRAHFPQKSATMALFPTGEMT